MQVNERELDIVLSQRCQVAWLLADRRWVISAKRRRRNRNKAAAYQSNAFIFGVIVSERTHLQAKDEKERKGGESAERTRVSPTAGVSLLRTAKYSK